MTYEGAEFSSEELFQELKGRVELEGAGSFASYRDLVEELIEEKKDFGFFDDNEDLGQIQRDLESRWLEFDGSMRATSDLSDEE